MKVRALDDHRSAPRRRVRERAVAILKPGVEVDCTILDTSETGARLTFRSRVILPKKFRLYLAAPAREVDVSVIWQKGTLAGVRYSVRLADAKVKSQAGFVRRLLAAV
ncbi:MAG TPA: PilZ domain-containing protein [Propylenella sp.]|nr:PilZ domain-containing protein [Propylenella sp.]